MAHCLYTLSKPSKKSNMVFVFQKNLKKSRHKGRKDYWIMLPKSSSYTVS